VDHLRTPDSDTAATSVTAPHDSVPAPPRAGFNAALAQLRSAQKSSKGAPFYSLYVNRPLGRVLAALAYQTNLTPNHVTAISACFTFAGIIALALATPSWLWAAFVAATLVLGYALDSADGQLARLRGGGSSTGEWLDHVIDCAKTSCLHLAVLITYYLHVELPSTALLLIPLGFTVVAAVHFFGMILTEQLARGKRLSLGLPASAPGSTPRWWSVAKLPTDYGVLCLSFLLLGAPLVFGTFYALLALANLGYLVLILGKWYRDMAAVDQLPAAAGAGTRP
jgi:phosphatidylglycerophosphate synthase